MAKFKQPTLFPGQSRVPSLQKRSSPKRKKPVLSQPALSFEVRPSQPVAPSSKQPKKKSKPGITNKRMRWETDDDASYARPSTQDSPPKKKRKVLHPTEAPVPVASTSRLPTPPSEPSSIPGIEEMSQLSYFDRTRTAQEKHSKFMQDRLQIQPAKRPAEPKKTRKKSTPPPIPVDEDDEEIAVSLTKNLNDGVLSIPSSDSSGHSSVPLKPPNRPPLPLKRSASDVVPRPSPPKFGLVQTDIPKNDLYLPPKPLSRSTSAPSVSTLPLPALDTNAQPSALDAPIAKSSQVSTQSQTLYEDTPPLCAPSTVPRAPSPLRHASSDLLPSQASSKKANLFAPSPPKAQTQIIESFQDVSTHPWIPRLFRSPSKSPRNSNIIESFIDVSTCPYVPRLLKSPSKSPRKSQKKVSFAAISPENSFASSLKKASPKKKRRVLVEETQFMGVMEQEVVEDSQFPEIPWEQEMEETQFPFVPVQEVVEEPEKSQKKRKAKVKSLEQQKMEAWSGQRPGSRQQKMGDFFAGTGGEAKPDLMDVDERKIEEERRLAALVQAGVFGKAKDAGIDAADEEIEEDEEEIISSQTQFVPTMAPQSPAKRIQVIPSSDAEDEDDPDTTLDEEMDTPIADWVLNPNTKKWWATL